MPGPSPRRVPLPGRKSLQNGLKNWRVRSRLLLLVVLPTLSAVILGGVAVAASIRSAAAYQRVEQFSRLGGEITGLVQGLQAEREDTIRYITMGQACGGRGAPHAAATPELAVLGQDYRVTDGLAATVRNLAGNIGSSYPAVARQEAQGAITAINGIPRPAQCRDRHPDSLLGRDPAVRRYDRPVARAGGEIATGGNDAALADTVRVVGLISGMKEEVSQEQAILTSALTPDLVGAGQFQPGQLSALNAAQAEQQADVAQFGLGATASQRQLYDSTLSSALSDRAQRLGIAYQLRPNTVIRATGGRFFDNWAAIQQLATNYQGNWPDTAFLGANNLNHTVPDTTAEDPTWGPAAKITPAPTPWTQVNFMIDPYYKNGYSWQWNLGVQQQFGADTVIEADYVGSHSSRLDSGAVRNTAVIPGPGPIAPRQPFPYITPTNYDKSISNANYHSLQAKVRTIIGHRLTFLGAYTWSKTIDTGHGSARKGAASRTSTICASIAASPASIFLSCSA